MRNEIINFAQSESEDLYEAWERFKKLLRKFPQHNLSQAKQVAKFNDGLLYYVNSTFDAVVNGEFDALPAQKETLQIKGHLAAVWVQAVIC
jgi:hypothetical protein